MRFKKFIALSLILFIFILTGCSTFTKTKENKELSLTLNNIKVSIDPRIELISIIIYLSSTYDNNIKSILPDNTTYKTDVENHFRQYEDHEVIKTFDSMYCTNYSYDAPPTTMLYLTNTPKLKIKNSMDKNDLTFKSYMDRAGGEDSFLKFVDQLNDFCKKSNFYKFYNDHMDYYESIVGTTVSNLSNTDYLSQVESYYRTTQGSYNIILCGLLYGNNYGPRIKDREGNYSIYSIQGSTGVDKNIPIYGDNSTFKYLVRHEFGHSFVNHITTDNINEVYKYPRLFDPIRETMVQQAYPSWEIALNEHLVRAVVIRLTEINDSKEAADKLISMEREKGFIYIDRLVDLLENEYEPNKDKYKTFKEFYPRILEELNTLNKE